MFAYVGSIQNLKDLTDSLCFSTAVRIFLLETRVRTPEEDPNITGATERARVTTPTRAREKAPYAQALRPASSASVLLSRGMLPRC